MHFTYARLKTKALFYTCLRKDSVFTAHKTSRIYKSRHSARNVVSSQKYPQDTSTCKHCLALAFFFFKDGVFQKYNSVVYTKTVSDTATEEGIYLSVYRVKMNKPLQFMARIRNPFRLCPRAFDVFSRYNETFQFKTKLC